MLDFCCAFYDHRGGDNGIRMPIISRTTLTPPDEDTLLFYRVHPHLGETAFLTSGIFKIPDAYEFHPVLPDPANAGSTMQLFIRKYADKDVPGPYGNRLAYKELFPQHSGWGTRFPIVPEVDATELDTFAKVRDAREDGAVIVARIPFETENGWAAVVDARVNCVVTNDDEETWQVQGGLVAYPKLTTVPTELIECFELAAFAFNSSAARAEFLWWRGVNVATGKEVVHHGNEIFAKNCQPTLWALP